MSNSDGMEFLKILEQDLPLTARPFHGYAEALRISEEELLSKIKAVKNEGIIRRYGGILAHRKAGFTWNAMVVSDIPLDEISKLADQIIEKEYVSHCYQREKFTQWPYTFYMMVHAMTEEKGRG